MSAYVLYLLGSLAGVAAIVGLSAALFGLRDIKISTADIAVTALAQDHPGFRAGRVTLSADAKSALVENASEGMSYLVVVRGDRLVTRRLGRDALRKIGRSGNDLALRLADFTLPAVRLNFADAALAQSWQDAIEKGRA